MCGLPWKFFLLCASVNPESWAKNPLAGTATCLKPETKTFSVYEEKKDLLKSTTQHDNKSSTRVTVLQLITTVLNCCYFPSFNLKLSQPANHSSCNILILIFLFVVCSISPMSVSPLKYYLQYYFFFIFSFSFFCPPLSQNDKNVILQFSWNEHSWK